MAETQPLIDWQQAVSHTYRVIEQNLNAYLPLVVGAVAILLVGWLLSIAAGFLVRKLTLAGESLILRSAKQRGIEKTLKRSYSGLAGRIVFWTCLLFFIAVSANFLGWSLFSEFVGTLISYLPNLFASLLVIVAGVVLGNLLYSLVDTAASSAGFERPGLLARLAQATTILTALVIAIEQLGINITFITTTFIVVTGVLLFGAALAFGLGARQYVANLIGAQVSRRHYQVGQWIKLPDVQGQLLEITPVALVLDSENGRLVIPASHLQRQVAEIVTDRGEPEDEVLPGASLIGAFFRKKDESND